MLRVWRVIKNDNLMKPKTFFPGDFNALHQHKSVSFMVNIEIKVGSVKRTGNLLKCLYLTKGFKHQ